MIYNQLKSTIKKATPYYLRHLARRLGGFYDTMDGAPRREKFPSQEATFQTLSELGWRPKVCIDIGAYQGEWAKMFSSIFTEAQILMIEAQESKRPHLERAVVESHGKHSLEIALLGSEQGREVTFCEMETGSSVFEEQSHFPRVAVRKQLSSLDQILTKRTACAAPQCIKLDTQGYELEVLKGAQETLKKTDVVMMEVSFVRINRGCPPFAEVIAFMNQAGFGLFDICSQIRRRDGVLWQSDVLFIRVGGNIKIDARLTPENW